MEKGQGKGTDTLQTDNVFTRKEYIERDSFIADQRHLYCENCDRRRGMKDGKMTKRFVYAIGEAPCRACDIGDMLDSLEDYVPAADVVARDCYDRLLAENDELRKERPVAHGRWIDVEVKELAYYKMMIASMRCDRCGRYHNEVYHYGNPTEMAKYCGFCGALMDKDGDGE